MANRRLSMRKIRELYRLVDKPPSIPIRRFASHGFLIWQPQFPGPNREIQVAPTKRYKSAI